jgi:serine protease Do
MYELPNFNFKQFKNKILRKKKILEIFYLVVSVCLIVYILFIWSSQYFPEQTKDFFRYFKLPQIEFQKPEIIEEENASHNYVSEISYEQAIIDVVSNANQSVVSIVISKDLPVYKQEWVNPFGDGFGFEIQVPQYVQRGTEYKKIGSGSGFIVSTDGLILTNKHVVSDKDADYVIVTNNGKEYPAKILAKDPVQDLALIKIENADGIKFQPLKLGDSSGIRLGQTAIAIGNALGEFSNTVSVGIISGLSRTISASDQTGLLTETLEDIIQTDAAINSGNSGGPLLNLKGEVIGINTAIAQDAQSIAFAIPINYAKKDIDQVMATNTIVYPFLGVRYAIITKEIKEEYGLSVDYGAFIFSGENGESAITKDSAADKAGIKEKDIILELNGEKITKQNTLAKVIQKYNAGDSINLKILRENNEIKLQVTLGERTS